MHGPPRCATGTAIDPVRCEAFMTKPASIRTTNAVAPGAGIARVGAPARELAAFLTQLIEIQCQLAGAIAGIAWLASGERRAGGATARWARDQIDLLDRDEVLAGLETICEQTTSSGRGQITSLTLAGSSALYGSERSLCVLSTPLRAGDQIEGATALVLARASPTHDEAALQRVGLTNANFESFLWRQHAMNEARQKLLLREALELLDAALQGQSAPSMGSLLCHELQRRFGCTRASIGLVGGGDRLRLVAVSGSEDIDRRAPAAEALEAAMEECALQDIELVWPEARDTDAAQARVLHAHEKLSLAFGPSSILSLPLRVEGDLVGVAVLEREISDPFPPGSIPLLRLVGEFIGPALWTRRLADRGVLAVMRDRAKYFGSLIVGPRHTGAKIIGLIVIVALLAATLVPIPARVVADAEVRVGVSRTIVPPYSGFLDEVLVKPGTVVVPGQVLARMGTDEIGLQLDELLARRTTLIAQRDDAQTRSQSADVAIADASILQVDAEIELVRDHLARAVIVSPIAGIVSRGELEDYIGARIDPTQPLFEIVTDDRVVIARIDERDIARVRVGQEGWLVSKALPDERVAVRVVRINPVAEAVRGANVYLVEAEVLDGPDGKPAWLRPGMTGVVKLSAGSTTVMRSLVGPMIDELRLRLWW